MIQEATSLGLMTVATENTGRWQESAVVILSASC